MYLDQVFEYLVMGFTKVARLEWKFDLESLIKMVPGSKSIIPPVVFLCRYLCMVTGVDIAVQMMKMPKRISSCPSHW